MKLLELLHQKTKSPSYTELSVNQGHPAPYFITPVNNRGFCRCPIRSSGPYQVDLIIAHKYTKKDTLLGNETDLHVRQAVHNYVF